MNGKIYKITNMITGEYYIGKTIKTLDERFNQHRYGIRQPKRYRSKLQNAMEEYGTRNFIIELIEENIDADSRLILSFI